MRSLFFSVTYGHCLKDVDDHWYSDFRHRDWSSFTKFELDAFLWRAFPRFCERMDVFEVRNQAFRGLKPSALMNSYHEWLAACESSACKAKLHYLSHIIYTLGLKRVAKSDHFMKYTAQTPYIWLLIVLPVFPDLWRHNKGSSYFGFSKIKCFIHEFRNAEITYFHLIGSSDEDVVCLEVSMQDFFIMNVLET